MMAMTYENVLWQDTPANHYTEAFPVGNGRIGAMPFGDPRHDTLVLNESSMWSGEPQQADREDAWQYLPEIERLMRAGQNTAAQRVFEEHFNCKGPGTGRAAGANLEYGSYQTLGELTLDCFQSVAGSAQCEGYADYRRALDMTSGIATLSFRLSDTVYERKCIASRKDDAIFLLLTASDADGKQALGKISFNMRLNRAEKRHIAPVSHGVMMAGQLDNGKDGKGTRYCCVAMAKTSGGSIYSEDDVLCVRDANEALIVITALTNLKSAIGGRRSEDPEREALEDARRLVEFEWAEALKRHAASYDCGYSRVRLKLGAQCADERALDKRIRASRAGEHALGLEELYFNYARYLLMCSSRPGGLPANLQGIWGDEIQMPWNGDWHMNAQQMMFWPAGNCNLPETEEPFIAMVESLQAPGARTAWNYYHAHGWMMHVVTNPWGYTAPGEDAYWGASAMSSAWVCQHLWDHYLFDDDISELRRYFPVLKGCAQFYLDALTVHPDSGYLVTRIGTSPENQFYMPDGSICSVCMGPTYDMQLIRYLFKACREACEALNIKDEFYAEICDKLPKLQPTRVTSDGRVAEWDKEYAEYRVYHRHTSHLWGAYPGDEITPENTPELANAAKKSLETRGLVTGGWSNMHRAAIMARLHDGEGALKYLRFHLQYNLFPNLFCRNYQEEFRYPPVMPDYEVRDFPFQIDANIAYAAVVGEMLLQSHIYHFENEKRIFRLTLLPALPPEWRDGRVSSLRARGNIKVDIEWRSGALNYVSLCAREDHKIELAYDGKFVIVELKANETLAFDKAWLEAALK